VVAGSGHRHRRPVEKACLHSWRDRAGGGHLVRIPVRRLTPARAPASRRRVTGAGSCPRASRSKATTRSRGWQKLQPLCARTRSLYRRTRCCYQCSMSCARPCLHSPGIELMKRDADPRADPTEKDIAFSPYRTDPASVARCGGDRRGARGDRPLALAAEEAARYEHCSVSGARSPWAAIAAFRQRMVRNLLDNAERHGVPPIGVDVGPEGACAVMTVSDHEGQMSRPRPHLRSVLSRTRQRTGGAGLGLPWSARLPDSTVATRRRQQPTCRMPSVENSRRSAARARTGHRAGCTTRLWLASTWITGPAWSALRHVRNAHRPLCRRRLCPLTPPICIGGRVYFPVCDR
jgi:hypothetical protein